MMLHTLEVQMHTHYFHKCITPNLLSCTYVQSTIKPSLKPGSYQVWIMLKSNDLGYASVNCATCQCAAN